jgi:hypothetical protein
MTRHPAFLLLLALLAVSACAAAATTAAPSPRPAPRPPAVIAWCAWYSPVLSAPGQLVTVTATGPACASPALVTWVARTSGRLWIGTATAPAGTCIAQLARAGMVVQVWQDGAAPPTDQAAGYLADAFAAAGWAVQQPPASPPLRQSPVPDVSQ